MHFMTAEAIIEREARVRDAEADDYAAIRDEELYERQIEEAAALGALDLRPGETVLDAGCGTGQQVEMLLAAAGRTPFASCGECCAPVAGLR